PHLSPGVPPAPAERADDHDEGPRRDRPTRSPAEPKPHRLITGQRKRAPRGARFGFVLRTDRGLDRLDVRRLLALGTLDDVELHFLTFGQRAVALTGDCREVNEHVVPVGTSDEAVALLVAEPLDRALRQRDTSLHFSADRSRQRGRERSTPPHQRQSFGHAPRMRYSPFSISPRTAAMWMAAWAASPPLLPLLPPARSRACATVSVVSTPSVPGT